MSIKKFAVLLIICAASVLGIQALAEEYGDWQYSVNEDGTASINEYHGTDTEVIVPSSLGDVQVRDIAEIAFYKNADITAVTVSEGIKNIGAYAFEMCRALTEVNIPSSVESIGEGAFKSCQQLETLTVAADNPVYTASENVLFDKSAALVVLCVPAKTGKYTVPSDITGIEAYAFYECAELTQVVLPMGVSDIGESAFSGCKRLEDVVFPASLEEIPNGAFSGCRMLKNVVIPEGVKKIGNEAFYNCDGLAVALLPESLTEMGTKVFDGHLASFVICAQAQSFAAEYAAENDIVFSTLAETPYGILSMSIKAPSFYMAADKYAAVEFTVGGLSAGNAAVPKVYAAVYDNAGVMTGISEGTVFVNGSSGGSCKMNVYTDGAAAYVKVFVFDYNADILPLCASQKATLLNVG